MLSVMRARLSHRGLLCSFSTTSNIWIFFNEIQIPAKIRPDLNKCQISFITKAKVQFIDHYQQLLAQESESTMAAVETI